ncbi:hypothetical protein FACS189468_7600 [Spirochaetia bacterium]|nr:hypothetical protein FACS189468_7600 [Spirochaetia bacterium]
MFNAPILVHKAIPEEYRNIAGRLFPPGNPAHSGGQGPDIAATADFADILGIGADYRKLLNTHRSDKEISQFLGHFQNNLDLLIQKTWVEKGDEIRKEKLQDRIPPFIAVIEAGDFEKALGDFGAILDELAYLFFGPQSNKEDFTEYTLRIDSQMGLFWWYGGQIGGLRQDTPVREGSWVQSADKELLKAVLFIGLCYLTNF